jgi:tungstate transport system ATP-binding protein
VAAGEAAETAFAVINRMTRINASDSILNVHDLVIQRGERTVLTVDRLQVTEGEVLAVIGPNGAGKSTLLLALARLLRPVQGQIIFRGRPLEALRELDYRRRIALVLQEPLLLDISVFENVAAGLRYRRLPKTEVNQRVGESLTRLGVAHLSDRRARQLSGGEAQRVSLARAFAIRPEILLLDEPFSALDAPTRLRLLEDFQSLLAEIPITTLFITHDLDEALLLGDQVAVLLGGRLRQVGPPEVVFNAPADEDVAAFVGVETVIPGKVIESMEGVLVVEAGGLHLEAVGEAVPGRAVLLCLRPEDVTIWPQDGSPSSSARNRLAGRIVRATPQGPLVRLLVDCGFPLVALVTRASARELDLSEGRRVTAAFKASAVHLITR